ncbi:MAG: 5-(carboxyamino)imidazole ribonucleotide synthase [Bacteroidota bacterium]
MANDFSPETRIGIAGGGQLGRMLLQAGIDLNLDIRILDPDPKAPCAGLAPFTTGKLTDYDTLLNFGRGCDLITIEIENENTSALRQLVTEGKKVYPQPEVIELIQDKRRQKKFYLDNGIPTAPFVLTENKADVLKHAAMLPCVNKLGREGYDGRGVQIMRKAEDLENAFDAPGLVESLIDFEKEISVIVARNEQGEIRTFPAVEMMFHPTGNMVEFLFSPASVTVETEARAAGIAKDVITRLGMTGLLAVEMFVTRDGEVLVNEIAPRPHNSGHQTIEGNATSQYHQHLRAILGLPLGSTDIRVPSAMVNLLGAEGHSGPAAYAGLQECLALDGVNVHLYGKAVTKPLRKMGHVTITGRDMTDLRAKAEFVKRTLRVVTGHKPE